MEELAERHPDEGLAHFWTIKSQVRAVGIDDGPFEKYKPGTSIVVGAVCRGGGWLDGVMRTDVEVDGDDAGSRIAAMVNTSRHKGQIRVIFLNGITFGGFNTVDIARLNQETGLPVIVVMRRRPDREAILEALEGLPHRDQRVAAMAHAGPVHAASGGKDKTVFLQVCGISLEDAMEVVQVTSTRSVVPEPLRLAHLIASGVTLGDSRGGA